MDAVVLRLATWRSACTPASVRLAPTTRVGAPRIRSHPPATSPWMVGRPGWYCQPWNSVPS